MRRILALMLVLLLVLSGCSATEQAPIAGAKPIADYETVPIFDAPQYASRFDSESSITLSDDGIVTDAEGVFTSHDIIYYEDRTAYDSGNPYGEGGKSDAHGAEEAAAHTVVNITKAGAYRVTGSMSAGQIRIDLGENACTDPNAVVELILDHADITCTVAPAILFLNVYECDSNRSAETATSEVDTAAAGANLILAQGSRNLVDGSYVAKIYKDQEGEKKLWKQDGAIYSYMSMNVFGPGALDISAENEGLDTELHLTINGGDIVIRSGNDGINTNEDNVSVTTINGGDIHIIAGLGEEGDGIDSNGYLVINGGTVIASANPASDAGMDSDLGSFIHGGTVVALGSTMDWAESDSKQVTMNLQFAAYQDATDSIVVTLEDGTEIFSYDPAADTALGAQTRKYMGAVISCAQFQQEQTYLVYVGGSQMMYTGTDVRRGPGGMGGGFGGGQRPDGGQPPELPDDGTMPGGWADGGKGQRPDDKRMPEGEMPIRPEGEKAGRPGGDRGDWEKRGESAWQNAEGSILFYMQDKVNCFSGLTAVQ